MFIDKEKWNKLIESFSKVYSNYDYFSDNMKDLIDEVDICIDDIKRNINNKIYVVTNNAVYNDEIDYSLYGVTTNKEYAKKLFKDAVRDAKCDSDFDNINPVDIKNIDKLPSEEWCFEESEDSFELFLNGEYNSNNFSIKILEYDVENKKELDMEV